jgi:hypothetical protein
VEYSEIIWRTSDQSLGSKKETICHRASSTKNPWVEITVSVNALQTHLAHGDLIGKCGDSFEYHGTPNDQPGVVTVCHRTSCDKAPFVELLVPSGQLQAHLDANGQDFVGECLQNPDYVKKSYGYNNNNRNKVEKLFKQTLVC